MIPYNFNMNKESVTLKCNIIMVVRICYHSRCARFSFMSFGWNISLQIEIDLEEIPLQFDIRERFCYISAWDRPFYIFIYENYFVTSQCIQYEKDSAWERSVTYVKYHVTTQFMKKIPWHLREILIYTKKRFPYITWSQCNMKGFVTPQFRKRPCYISVKLTNSLYIYQLWGRFLFISEYGKDSLKCYRREIFYIPTSNKRERFRYISFYERHFFTL